MILTIKVIVYADKSQMTDDKRTDIESAVEDMLGELGFKHEIADSTIS